MRGERGVPEVTLTELRCREVINLCDGARLGFVSDLLLDLTSGCIAAIIVPAQGGLLGFLGRGEDCVIPWSCIDQIGADIIFVRYEPAHRPAGRDKQRCGG